MYFDEEFDPKSNKDDNNYYFLDKVNLDDRYKQEPMNYDNVDGGGDNRYGGNKYLFHQYDTNNNVNKNMNPYNNAIDFESISSSSPNMKMKFNIKEEPKKEDQYERNWIEEFYFSNHTETPESYYENISKIGTQFVECAEYYGRIIISEKNLPTEQKTIKPINIGGIAGGEKFSVQGIIFKFSVDVLIREQPTTYLYGGKKGSDEKSRKAAGMELACLEAIYSSQVTGFYLPLMALVDFKGFRLICVSKLPINKKTIVYGSGDGGQTIHNNPSVCDTMKKLGEKLNLRGHQVGSKKDCIIYGPGDIEVHMGSDNNYYLIDFGRVMPPESPNVSKRDGDDRSIFYKFLRPELVKYYKKSLCSDTFSVWDCNDPYKKDHQVDLNDATIYLYEKLIPRVSYQINKKMEEYIFENYPKHGPVPFKLFLKKVKSFSISGILHSGGVNVRHLGKVRKLLSKDCSVTRAFLLENAVARVLKNILNKRMRKLMNQLKVPCDEPFQELIAEILNMISLDHDENTLAEFWNDKVQKKLIKHFGVEILQEPSLTEINLIKKIAKKDDKETKEFSTGIEKEIKIENERLEKERQENNNMFRNFSDKVIKTSGVVGGALKSSTKYIINFGRGLKHDKKIMDVNKNTKRNLKTQFEKIDMDIPLFAEIRPQVVFAMFLELTGIRLSKSAMKVYEKEDYKCRNFSFGDIEKLNVHVKHSYYVELASGLRRIFIARQQRNEILKLRIYKRSIPFLERGLYRGSLNPLMICAFADIHHMMADIYLYQRKPEKALHYFKKAADIYRSIDSEKTDNFERNGWALLRNNDAVCLYKYGRVLAETFRLENGISAAFAFGRAKKLIVQRNFIIKNRIADFKIIFNEKLMWLTYKCEKDVSRSYESLVGKGKASRNVVFSDYILYLKGDKWVRFWVALVSSQIDDDSGSSSLNSSFDMESEIKNLNKSIDKKDEVLEKSLSPRKSPSKDKSLEKNLEKEKGHKRANSHGNFIFKRKSCNSSSNNSSNTLNLKSNVEDDLKHSKMKIIIAYNKFVDEQVSIDLEIGDWEVHEEDYYGETISLQLLETNTKKEYHFAFLTLKQRAQWIEELDHFLKMALYKSGSSITLKLIK